jgi:hypothetical protein
VINFKLLREEVARHPYPLLFTTISGAHLYGFPSADSDYDLRGVHILPVRDAVGMACLSPRLPPCSAISWLPRCRTLTILTMNPYITIGMSNRRRLLMVAHADRLERTRIISARKLTHNERRAYEETRRQSDR